MQFQNILIVCVGNICRSPMAEYLLKYQYPNLQIQSAGIAGLVGQPADAKAMLCMQRLGINIQEHIAKNINADIIKQANLVLVMNDNQKRYIEQTYLFAKGKTFRLGHWQSNNIPDPYQHSQDVFDATCALIQQCVTDWNRYL